MDFFWKIAQKSRFWPKNKPKGPQGSIGTPHDDKNYCSELPGYENSMKEKRIFELSPIEKKLV